MRTSAHFRDAGIFGKSVNPIPPFTTARTSEEMDGTLPRIASFENTL